jgi:DNA-directed RNA polymerase II subunit RPB1
LRNGNTIRHEFPDGACYPEGDEEVAAQPLTAAFVQQILAGIEQRDVELLGFKADSRPEWMVLEKLCIPPPIIRPSIKPNDDSRARGEDDITLELQEILKLDTKLANSTKPAERKMLEEELQAHIGMYIHHDSKASGTTGGAVNFGHGAPHSNRERRFYHKRLKGKHGRMRHNLNGKRVEKCARSVVSPGPKYDIDEVGVPRSIALRLTLTEKVNRHNVEALTRRVHNGPNRLDGAASVIQEDGTDIDLSLLADPRTIVLCSGWSVRRYLQSGDTVLFNRQPSLHKMSIMAHTVRLTDDLTFRLPVCNATPYNADFDGDEMLFHCIINKVANAVKMFLFVVVI